MATPVHKERGLSGPDESRKGEADTSPGVSDDEVKLEAAPDGGSKAWLVAVGAGSACFCALGFTNSFGVFQQYYTTHQLQDEPVDKVSWIGSLSTYMQFFTGLIAGPLFDRHGAWIMRPAAVAYVLAIMLMSLCKEYWHFMLCQGILLGVSMGFMMYAALAAVSQYFNKNRGAAMGISVSGSSLGGVVIPLVLSKMLSGTSLGFGWSVRILGFIMAVFAAFATATISARLPPRTTSFLIPSAFKEVQFDALIVAVFCMFIGLFMPIFYLPSFAVALGVKTTLASYLLAILNAASTFGRIIPGIIADRVGRLNMLVLAGILNGVVVFCFSQPSNTAGLIVYSVIFGFTSGMIISGAAAAFTLCPKDPRDMGTYMGMGLTMSALAVLIGPPLNGLLHEKYGGYFEMSMFSGAICLVGGLVTFASKGKTPEGIWGKI